MSDSRLQPWRVAPLAAILAGALALLALAAAPSVAQAGCKGAMTASSKLNKGQARTAIRCLINKARGSRLRANGDLATAAQRHTNVMRKKGCRQHQCSGESDLYTRIARTGYFDGKSSRGWGEILAWPNARATPKDVVRIWRNSPSHNQIMKGNYEHLGVGVDASGKQAIYTVDFGRRDG